MRLCSRKSRRSRLSLSRMEVECAGHCVWRIRHRRGYLDDHFVVVLLMDRELGMEGGDKV